MTSEQLKEFLNRHNLSAHKYAEVIGVTGPAVDHWITGRRRIPTIAAKMCRILDQYPQMLPWVGSL